MKTDRKIDDAHWHWNGNWPEDLHPPEDYPVPHLAMFLVWAIERGLAGPEHSATDSPEVTQLRARALTPWEYVEKRVVFRLETEDFNERGLAFVGAYYGHPPIYFVDFCETFPEAETGYHVADSWENYDRLAPVLDEAFEYQRENGSMDGWE